MEDGRGLSSQRLTISYAISRGRGETRGLSSSVPPVSVSFSDFCLRDDFLSMKRAEFLTSPRAQLRAGSASPRLEDVEFPFLFSRSSGRGIHPPAFFSPFLTAPSPLSQSRKVSQGTGRSPPQGKGAQGETRFPSALDSLSQKSDRPQRDPPFCNRWGLRLNAEEDQGKLTGLVLFAKNT